MVKVNIDYETVLDATNKLQNGKALSDEEKKEVVTLLLAVQGDYIPTRHELKRHKSNLARLDIYNINTEAYEHIYNEVSKFEGKYY